MGEGSFDTIQRNDIHLSALKSALNLEEEVFSMKSAAGTGPFVRLHSKINVTVYKEILKKHVINLRIAINQPVVFMQDNTLCHTLKSVKTFLSEEDITVMEWPAQSPDMNPIENVWKLLNERAKEKNPRNVEELWTNSKGENIR